MVQNTSDLIEISNEMPACDLNALVGFTAFIVCLRRLLELYSAPCVTLKGFQFNFSFSAPCASSYPLHFGDNNLCVSLAKDTSRLTGRL